MNNYLTEQSSWSTSNVVIYGMLATQLLATGTAQAIQPADEQKLVQQPYEVHASPSSYDQLSGVTYDAHERSTDEQLIAAVSGFYSNLLENSEPLGREFEQVLNENLWDLYET